MFEAIPRPIGRLAAAAGAGLAMLALGACAVGSHNATAAGTTSSTTDTLTAPLPGVGKPTVTIGDKNFTEQFVLGELYYQALAAEGFSVVLDRNIGPTEVTVQALANGSLDMYPEYLSTWDSAVAGYKEPFGTVGESYNAGQAYAIAHGFALLHPTRFSDTNAIAVTFNYALHNHLETISDLQKVQGSLAFGGPLQFQQSPNGLPAIEQVYGFKPASFQALDIGAQYQALDKGTVQAADVNTTDGQLITGNYTLLKDPLHVFGYGNVVPVVTQKALEKEGPAFVDTINEVSSMLTNGAVQELNAAVDLSGQDPRAAARQFLASHGFTLVSTGQ